MSLQLSDMAQTIKVYNLRADTQEFIGEGEAYIPPHTGLPANCTDMTPPDFLTGHVAIFDSASSAWVQIEDHRGEVVYDIETQEPMYVSQPGPLPDNITGIAPEGLYIKWNGTAWVKDEEAEKAALKAEAENKKNTLMQMAGEKIAPLQDAVDLDEATQDESAKLIAWKKYRIVLNRIDTANVATSNWPETPE